MHSGIIEGLPIGDYHADPAISKSGLKFLLDPEKTPAHFFYEYRLPNIKKPKPSKEKIFGNAFHTAVLEPDLFPNLYVQGPDISKNSNAWKEFVAEAELSGRIVLDAADMEKIDAMAERLNAHETALHYLPHNNENVLVEASFFWTDPATGVRCKCRPDILLRDSMIPADLKTVRSASEAAFKWDINNYGYDIQDAIYTSGVNVLSPDLVNDFVFICVEKEPPYEVALWRLTPKYKKSGYVRFRRGTEIFGHCEKKNAWPGFDPAVRDIDPPDRIFRELGITDTTEEEEPHEPEEYQNAA